VTGQTVTTPTTPLFAVPSVYTANMHAIAAHVGEAGAADRSAKVAYLHALDRIQRDPIPKPFEATPVVHFWEPEGDRFPGFLDNFLQNARPTDDIVIPADERARVEEHVADGLRTLAEYRHDYAAMVNELIGAVICAHSPEVASASVSSHLGMIALQGELDPSEATYAEALLHEALHQAQFLDEMVARWYSVDPQEMGQPEDLVVSPIRRVPRAFNLTLAAVCVAAVLVDFLWWAGERDRATEMCKSTLLSLSGLKEREHLLAPRGRDVLQNLATATSETAAFAALT
jgi:hypothetical protein